MGQVSLKGKDLLGLQNVSPEEKMCIRDRALYSHLLEKGYRVTVEHRDMMKNNVEEDYNPHEIITLDN